MRSSSLSFLILTILSALLICSVQSAAEQTRMETMALSRDGYYRSDPDALLFGFFAAWPLILWIIAAAFLVVAVLGFLGHVTGICYNRDNQGYRASVQI